MLIVRYLKYYLLFRKIKKKYKYCSVFLRKGDKFEIRLDVLILEYMSFSLYFKDNMIRDIKLFGDLNEVSRKKLLKFIREFDMKGEKYNCNILKMMFCDRSNELIIYERIKNISYSDLITINGNLDLSNSLIFDMPKIYCSGNLILDNNYIQEIKDDYDFNSKTISLRNNPISKKRISKKYRDLVSENIKISGKIKIDISKSKDYIKENSNKDLIDLEKAFSIEKLF